MDTFFLQFCPAFAGAGGNPSALHTLPTSGPQPLFLHAVPWQAVFWLPAFGITPWSPLNASSFLAVPTPLT